jgi:hydroxypyruvate isomerase
MTRYTVNCSILFPDVPLLERPAAAAAAGFDAVEFWWPFPESVPGDAEVDAFVAAVRNAGVQLTGLNFAAGDMAAGDRGLVSWPGRGLEFRDAVGVAVGIAGQLGTGVFNALYGNRVDGADPEAQDELATQNLSFAAAAAAEIGATVVLEPLSGASRYPLLSAAAAIAVADRVGAPNIALLADLYHLAVNGDDLSAVIDDYAGRTGHVQIADAPGRHEPGTGDIPFDRHLTVLADAGYGGWVGLEYAPTTAATAFDWLPLADRGTRKEHAK